MNLDSLTYKIFEFKKIPVNLNLLFLGVFIFLTPSLGISLFIAVLVHEMAHAWTAYKLNYYVDSININLLSGSAMIRGNIPPNDSIKITAAGPLSNLILASSGLLFYIALRHFVGLELSFLSDFMLINGLLFIFNVFPISPMDGGIMLRDYLYMRTSRREANKITNWTSLITSIVLYSFCIISGYLIASLFFVYFIYLSVKKLKIIK